jgi:hypothetical protein
LNLNKKVSEKMDDDKDVCDEGDSTEGDADHSLYLL